MIVPIWKRMLSSCIRCYFRNQGSNRTKTRTTCRHAEYSQKAGDSWLNGELISSEIDARDEQTMRSDISISWMEGMSDADNRVHLFIFQPNTVIESGSLLTKDQGEEFSIRSPNRPTIALVSKCSRCLVSEGVEAINLTQDLECSTASWRRLWDNKLVPRHGEQGVGLSSTVVCYCGCSE